MMQNFVKGLQVDKSIVEGLVVSLTLNKTTKSPSPSQAQNQKERKESHVTLCPFNSNFDNHSSGVR